MNRNLWNGQVDQFRLRVRRHSLILFFSVVALGMTLILSYDLPGTRQVDVTIDRPAPNDLFSPRSLTFTSDLLTTQARDQAARAVPDAYTPLDLQIGRTQLAPVSYTHLDLAFYVNDILLTQLSDSSLSEGRIGLDAGSFAGNALQVSFDNVSVTTE